MQTSTINLLSEINLNQINKVSREQNSVKTVSKNPKIISDTIKLMLKSPTGCVLRGNHYQLIVGKKSPVTYRAFLKYPKHPVTCQAIAITFE